MVDPVCKSGGLWIFLGMNITICQILKSKFCVEVDCEAVSFEGKCWIIFIYANTMGLSQE